MRFMIFCYYDYEASGGVKDFAKGYSTFDEVKRFCKILSEKYSYNLDVKSFQVYNLEENTYYEIYNPEEAESISLENFIKLEENDWKVEEILDDLGELSQ